MPTDTQKLGPHPGSLPEYRARELPLSLAGWSLQSLFRATEHRLTMLDFPRFTRDTFGLHAVELNSIFFDTTRPADLDALRTAADAAAKALGRNPRELAEELASALRESLGAAAARVETAGPGFINITVARDAIAADVERAANEGAEWGKAPEGGSARAAAPPWHR